MLYCLIFFIYLLLLKLFREKVVEEKLELTKMAYQYINGNKKERSKHWRKYIINKNLFFELLLNFFFLSFNKLHIYIQVFIK